MEIRLLTKSNCMRTKMINTIREVVDNKVYAAIKGNVLTVRFDCTDKVYKKVKAEILDVISPRFVEFC